MKKELILYAGLFFFIIATACQKQEKNNNNEKSIEIKVEKKIGKASTNNNSKQISDTISKGLQRNNYKEISYPTPNVDTSRKNSVEGVILHHTAEPTIERSLEVLTIGKRKVGTHVVIDTDGTRYIMCEPEVVTYHAGFSVLNGKEGCNYFTIGIEFQGNTLVAPLTQDQIDSAIEYLKQIIKKYNIPLSNIVTHEMVRQEYKRRYPHKKCSGKVDITQTEYKRFMLSLKSVYDSI